MNEFCCSKKPQSLRCSSLLPSSFSPRRGHRVENTKQHSHTLASLPQGSFLCVLLTFSFPLLTEMHHFHPAPFPSSSLHPDFLYPPPALLFRIRTHISLKGGELRLHSFPLLSHLTTLSYPYHKLPSCLSLRSFIFPLHSIAYFSFVSNSSASSTPSHSQLMTLTVLSPQYFFL